MADYKSGARSTTLPGRTPPKLMIELSKPITDAEIEAAAAYFSALQPRKRIKVIESSPTICSASKAGTLDRPGLDRCQALLVVHRATCSGNSMTSGTAPERDNGAR